MNQHLPQLDGLRGIAILIVVLGHLTVLNFGLGVTRLGPIPPLGVDLFFVLSRFLITRILLQSREQPNYFKSFYARRALRIWPLYFMVLAILFAATNHRIPALTFDENRLQWPVFVFYIQNVFYKQASELGPLALAITWSLAVEEQFYAIWPIVVRKLSIRALITVLVATIVLAPVARFVAPRFGVDPYMNPVCLFDAIAMGGLLAIWTVTHPSWRVTAPGKMWSILSLAVLAEVICHFAGLTHYLSKTIVSAAFTGLLALGLHSDPLIRTLSNRALCFLGRVSYCIYLAHPIVAAMVLMVWPGAGFGIRLLRATAIGVVSFAIAALSWRFFEEPILRLKKYVPPADAQCEARLSLA